jgi:hypothetical protein
VLPSIFFQPNSFCNYKSVSHYLHFKTIYSRQRNIDALFLINVFRTKWTVLLLWTMLVSVYAISKLDTFPPLTTAMSQDSTPQQGASQLQTTSSNLWTFRINKHLPWGYIFLCLILSYVIIVLSVLFYYLVLYFNVVLPLILGSV